MYVGVCVRGCVCAEGFIKADRCSLRASAQSSQLHTVVRRLFGLALLAPGQGLASARKVLIGGEC